MSRIKKKYIRFGTGTEDVNAQALPATNTPTAYTPVAVASEGTDRVSAHLNGINNAIAAAGGVVGDIGLTSFSAAANQTAQAVTGLAFSNGSIRSFRVQLSVTTASDLMEAFDMLGVQTNTGWQLSSQAVGDETGYTFTINSSGQVLYTSPATTATIKFRATITPV